MTDCEEVDSVHEAVKLLHKNRFAKAYAWTDALSQFKHYVDSKSHKNTFFKVFQTPSSYRYSEDSHQRISSMLSGLMVNLEVQRFETGFQKSVYLLRSEHNYITLSKLIKLKRRNLQQPDLKFVLTVMGFLSRLIEVLVEEQIECQISLSTLCFREDKVRLCDYNLMFFPCNKRSQADRLQFRYLEKAKVVVYQLLEQIDEKLEVKIMEATSMLLRLSEKEPYKSNQLLMEVLRRLLLENYLDARKLEQVTKKMIYDSSTILTDSNISVSGEEKIGEVPEAHLQKAVTMSTVSSSDSDNVKFSKTHSRRFRLFFSTVFLMVVLAGLSYVVYFFFFRPPICKQDEYSENSSCVPCPLGCKQCLGKLTNMCTSCKGLRWLVKETESDSAGSCAEECQGQIAFSESRLCIMHGTSTQ